VTRVTVQADLVSDVTSVTVDAQRKSPTLDVIHVHGWLVRPAMAIMTVVGAFALLLSRGVFVSVKPMLVGSIPHPVWQVALSLTGESLRNRVLL
jgi:hypothetical protein